MWAPSSAGLGGAGSFAARTRQMNSGTVLASDAVIRSSAATGSQGLQLPSAASSFQNGIGAIFTFKKIDATANPVVVMPAGADKIDGGPDVSLTSQNETITIQSNGAGWDVLFRG